MNQIIFIHLYNDRSGSPKVLASIIDTLKKNQKLILYVGSAGSGILDKTGIETTKYYYARTSSKLVNATIFFLSQFILLFRLLLDRRIERNAVIYVNTILPFGAALFGALSDRRVIYHLHEVSISPRFLMKMLVAIARRTASEFVYVSRFHMAVLPIRPERSRLLLNAVDPELYCHSLTAPITQNEGKFRILMLASLKDYKGIPEFLKLATRLEHIPNLELTLVANASEDEISNYFGSKLLPINVKIYPATDTPWDFYSKADLLLNLSRVDKWLETFGMTIIEAMCFGVPSIGPSSGGPCEIIRHGIDGYLVDSRNGEELYSIVERLILDREVLKKMKLSAKRRAKEYAPSEFRKQIKELLRQND
jgi:glycosyltransferase involved in cell wall biosynthesis